MDAGRTSSGFQSLRAEPLAVVEVGVSSFEGYVDRIENGVVFGWANRPKEPDAKVEVELLIDGAKVVNGKADRFRADLKAKGIGDGALGYALVIPAEFYDDLRHSVAVRIAGEELPLQNKRWPTVMLAANSAPKFAGRLLAAEGNSLWGVAFDVSSSNPVTVDLRVSGKVVKEVAANRTHEALSRLNGGAQQQARLDSCFEIDLSAISAEEILGDQITLQVAGTSTALEPKVADILLRSAGVDGIWVADTRLNGRVRCSALLKDAVELVLIDGAGSKSAVALSWSEANVGLAKATFWVPSAQNLSSATLNLQARVKGETRIVQTVPLVDFLSIDAEPIQLLKDPTFATWAGNRLKHWDVSEDLVQGTDAEPVNFALQGLQSTLFGPEAVRIDLRPGAKGHVLVQQEVSPVKLSMVGATVCLAVCARSDSISRSLLRLRYRLKSGEEMTDSFPFVCTKNWTLRQGRIAASVNPADISSVAVQFVLSDEVLPSRVWISAILVYGEGVTLESFLKGTDTDSRPVQAAESGNAVTNGNFELWDSGVRFLADRKRVATANGWVAASKSPGKDVRIGIQTVITRDIRNAILGEPRLGIRAHGTASAGYFRLETVLDKLQLQLCSCNVLRFHALSIAPQYDEAERKPNVISRICLVRRTLGVGDQTLAVVAQKVRVNSTGGYYEFVLKDWMLADTSEDLLKEGVQIVLLFEFSDWFDCTLSDVSLSPRSLLVSETQISRIALEDRNIAEQLFKLKGFDSWLQEPVSQPASAISRGREAIDRGLVRWNWTRPDDSVDVVIPVYNAVDEVLECLSSIERNTTIPHVVRIVNDGSTKLTALRLEDYARARPWVTVVTNEKNIGYTRSSNRGLGLSTAKWVVLLNSDTRVAKGWLEGMIECARSSEKIKFVGPLSNAATWQSVPDVQDENGKWKINELPAGLCADAFAELVAKVSPKAFPRVPILNGFCTLMDRAFAEQLGYLDEEAFPQGYGEENDLCIRVAKAGGELAIADHVYVYHVKSASFGKARRDALSKRGGRALEIKHPDVDLRKLIKSLSEEPVLHQMRLRLKQHLARVA